MTVLERIIVFPTDNSLGGLYLIYQESDQSKWWERQIGEAYGEVSVPLSGYLHLLVSPTCDLSNFSVLNPSDLASLDFRQRLVTDLELSFVQGLNGLRYLTLPKSPITDRGLMYLVNLKNLHTLDLGGTAITDAGLEYMHHLTSLRNLYLDGTNVTEAGIQELVRALPRCQVISRKLRTIRFPEDRSIGKVWIAEAGDDGSRTWRMIGKAHGMVQVSRRDFVRLELNDDSPFDRLASLKPDDIQSIDYIGHQLSDSDWAGLSHLSGLRELRLGGLDLPQDSFKSLFRFPHLRNLQLTACDIGDGALEDLSILFTLRDVRLSHCRISGLRGGLSSLSRIASLRTLLLEGDGIDDDALLEFNSESNLQELYIVYANVSDRGLACLRYFPELTSLVLRVDGVTEIGLSHLRQLRKLERLVVRAEEVADDCMIYLSKLTNLRDLTIRSLLIRGDSTSLFSDMQYLERLNVGAVMMDPDPEIANHRERMKFIVKDLPFLKELSLRYEGEAIEFENLPSLTKLDISNITCADNGIHGLETLTNLESISIKCSEELSDKTLKAMTSLTRLVEVDVSMSGVTNDGMAHLQNLPYVSFLGMAGGKLTNKALKHVSSLKELRYIDFPQSLKDEDLHHLQDLVKLRNLRLGNVTDEGMSWVARLNALRSLDFSRSQITDKTLTFLANFSKLKELNLSGTKITDLGLTHVGKLTKLQMVDLSDTEVSDIGLASISNLVNLKSIDLENCVQFQDAGLICLRLLTSLRWLNLNNSRVGDAGLAHIRGLRAMRALRLGSTLVTDAGAQNLSGLTGLEVLDLSCTDVTSEGVSYLADLTQLHELNLEGTLVDDQCVKYLQKLTRLRHLNLNGTMITAEALPLLATLPMLEHLSMVGTGVNYLDLIKLAEMPNLTRIAIADCGCSDEEMVDVLNALPYCEIDMISLEPRKVEEPVFPERYVESLVEVFDGDYEEDIPADADEFAALESAGFVEPNEPE
jgi:Leucine-rich repeat (LRR) protein